MIFGNSRIYIGIFVVAISVTFRIAIFVAVYTHSRFFAYYCSFTIETNKHLPVWALLPHHAAGIALRSRWSNISLFTLRALWALRTLRSFLPHGSDCYIQDIGFFRMGRLKSLPGHKKTIGSWLHIHRKICHYVTVTRGDELQGRTIQPGFRRTPEVFPVYGDGFIIPID
jgi:hypothetical protein